MIHIFKLAILTTIVLGFFFSPLLPVKSLDFYSTAFAEEPWKQELLDICSKTDEALSFSKDELKTLLKRGEKLKPAVEALEESPRKVYLKRLQKCMNLYSFVLESKEADKKP